MCGNPEININDDFPYWLILDDGERISADYLVDRFKSLILSDKLHAGYTLPNENTLCEKLGISRSTLREAFKVLSTYGLITRTTHVTYVNNSKDFSLSFVIDYRFEESSILEILEFRKMFEAESAFLAAQNATTDDIKELKKILIDLENCENDPSELSLNDVHFHSMIAKCTHNKLLISIMRLISDTYYKSIKSQFELVEYIEGKPALDRTIYYHNKIFDSILLKDSEAAASVMRDHMDSIAERIKALEEEKEKI